MTATAILPTSWALLDAALRARRPVQVTYHGRRRLICPHALGWNNDRAVVLGYQTGGQTSTGSLHPDPRKRWRCLFVDEIDHITAADPASLWQTADNYNASRPFPFNAEIATTVTTDEPTTTRTR
jgi:hypothetical protein